MLEKIRGKDDVDTVIVNFRYGVCPRGTKLHVVRHVSARVGVEIDGVLLFSPDVVDELTVAAGKIDDHAILADERLKKIFAQRLPNAHLAGPVGFAKTEPVELGKIRHW